MLIFQKICLMIYLKGNSFLFFNVFFSILMMLVINMKKIIIIKYGELNTKKANIGLFLKTLKNNIARVIDDDSIVIKYDKGRMYVDCKENDEEEILTKIKNVFGIHELTMGYELETNDFELVKEAVKALVSNIKGQTFKVETKRSDKNYFLTSLEISQKLGAIILKENSNLQVDVKNPESVVHIEIRRTNAYIYLETQLGLGGYPVGVMGKGLLMLSGGIDSPVAGFLAMKRGVKIAAIYFDSPPHTSIEAKNKVLKLASILSSYQGNIKVFVVPFTKLQETIYKEVPSEYMITIMRRMMYRISQKVAQKNNCKIIINGESIGQVASQTLDSMNVINEVVTMPVIRPVACFDKLEIIDLAKKINTYETSILPYEDCCTIFVPEHPVIYPKQEKCLEYEQKFAYEDLIEEAVANVKVINPNEKKDEFKKYL